MKPRTTATLPIDTKTRSFNEGDAEVFEFVYETYREYVHRICLKMLRDPAAAEDASQDVFLCLLKKIGTFRAESAFSSWLYRVATNSVLMSFRKNKITWTPLEEPSEDDASSYREIGRPDLNLAGVLDRIDLQTAIDVLPSGYKVAFILHDIQGYLHKEIGAMLGCSTETSKSQLHKAHRRLRRLLSGAPQNQVVATRKAQDSNESVLDRSCELS